MARIKMPGKRSSISTALRQHGGNDGTNGTLEHNQGQLLGP